MVTVSSKELQNQAARYLSGEMIAPERDALEVVLEFHEELRLQVAAMQEVLVEMAATELRQVAASSNLPA
jgi:hypothetical protein